MIYAKHYVPLESDPDLFTELMHELGVHSQFKFIDIWSLEDDMLAFVQRPVQALILILPSCPAYDQLSNTRPVPSDDHKISWFSQTINNACGLYAILHAVCNRPETIRSGSTLDRLSKVAPAERNKFIESSQEIEGAYIKVAEKGQTEAPSAKDEVEHHYICFVNVANRLYALDGDLEGPLRIGQLADGEDVLHAAGLEVIKKFVESKQGGSFGMLALVLDDQN